MTSDKTKSYGTKKEQDFLCFKNDLTATQAADICGVNRNTANRYYKLLRRAILSESVREVRNRWLRRKSHVNGMRTRKPSVCMEFREKAAGEVQRLQFRQICATLEGV